MNFLEFINEQKRLELNEVLITFNKKAYPKFNNIVILAGGAGSGKGFVTSNLLGIEGIVMDVDRLKSLAMNSDKLKERIKKETGHDISAFDLRKPENVSTIHGLLSKVIPSNERKVFSSVALADPERKPNIIFDVTLKDTKKLSEICQAASKMGYDKKNIHIVWVMNDINVAIEQNRNRSRVVPESILLQTHEGAQLTMKKILGIGEGIRSLLDGDIWIAFNKIGVDSKMEKSSNGGQYIKTSNILKIKETGKTPKKSIELGNNIIAKIAEYAPNSDFWKKIISK